MTAQEVLIFDSSTFVAEAGLTSEGASALKHFLSRRRILLGVPQVAVKECERNLTERAIGKKKQVKENLKWLARFFGQVKGWSGPSDQEIASRAKALAKAAHLGAKVLPETEALRKRAKLRQQTQRPPSHRRPGLADCLIWEQCLELLLEHDVVFVAHDKDFRGHGNDGELHPQLWAEAREVGKGRRLTFHPSMNSLLSELRSEISPIPKETVFAFIYDAIAAEIQEFEAESGYRRKTHGDVTQTLLTTDDAEVIEVRLKLQDTWASPDGADIAKFCLSGSCHYRVASDELSNLTTSELVLSVTQPDGSVRAIKGSYASVAAHIYAGASPIQPEPVILK